MADPEHIPGRVRQLRQQRKLSINRFAAFLSMPVATYHSYESGKHRPPISVMKEIAARTACDLVWLMTGQENAQSAGAAGTAEEESPYRSLPILATASAAEPERVAMEDHEGLGELPMPRDLHAVRVRGDSMAPVVLNGQYVLVSASPLGEGDLAVVELEGEDEVLFKRVHLADKQLVLVSVNPDPRLRPMLVKRRAVRRMRVIWGAKY